jgi:hypothetical protein
MAPRGRLIRAVRFTFADDKVTQLEFIADRKRLSGLELSVF